MRHTNYDDIAHAYDRRYRQEDYSDIERTLVEFVGDCSDVLEVGCGTGHWLQRLEDRGARTVGIDPSRSMLLRAREWWVYDYFDGTLALDKERYPPCEQIRDWMRRAGFTDTYSCVVQHEAGGVAAEAALRNGMITPSYTSQLAMLTAEELSAGLRRVEADLARNSRLQLCANLRVYATYGRRTKPLAA